MRITGNEISDYCSYFSHNANSVLEVGCGNSDLLAKLSGRRKVGIDFSEEYIAWQMKDTRVKALIFANGC